MRNAQNSPSSQSCPQCEEPKLPHRVCMKCGYYNGKEVLAVASDADE
jgi:large subunit ribosomal protein L32